MPIDPKQRIAELKRFHNALDDHAAPPGHPYRVEGIHAASGDPVIDLKTQIDFSDTANLNYFTGQRGTGKSSELLRLKQLLEQEGCFVLYADMVAYLRLTEPIELSDFLISMMGALSDCVREAVNATVSVPSYWERIAQFLQTEVKIEGATAAGVKLSLKDDPVFKKLVQDRAVEHTVKIVQSARAYANEAVSLLRHEKQNPALKVVFIVDSVERLRPTDSSRTESIFQSVVNLFAGQIDSLRFPLMHVVYSVPPYLAALSGGLGGLFGGAIYSLPSIHVFEKNSRTKSTQGVDILLRLVEKRYPEWRDVIHEADLRRLAEYSGGDIRDYFRLLRLCLVRAGRPDTALPIATEIVANAEHMVRNDMMPIAHNDLDWLKRISQSHQHELTEISKLQALARFLESKYVLNYRNGEDWYDVHPLLREIVDAHIPAISAIPVAASANA